MINARTCKHVRRLAALDAFICLAFAIICGARFGLFDSYAPELSMILDTAAIKATPAPPQQILADDTSTLWIDEQDIPRFTDPSWTSSAVVRVRSDRGTNLASYGPSSMQKDDQGRPTTYAVSVKSSEDFDKIIDKMDLTQNEVMLLPLKSSLITYANQSHTSPTVRFDISYDDAANWLTVSVWSPDDNGMTADYTATLKLTKTLPLSSEPTSQSSQTETGLLHA